MLRHEFGSITGGGGTREGRSFVPAIGRARWRPTVDNHSDRGRSDGPDPHDARACARRGRTGVARELRRPRGEANACAPCGCVSSGSERPTIRLGPVARLPRLVAPAPGTHQCGDRNSSRSNWNAAGCPTRRHGRENRGRRRHTASTLDGGSSRARRAVASAGNAADDRSREANDSGALSAAQHDPCRA